MRSLTWKLVLAFALVTLLAVSGVGLLARHAAVDQLSTYVTRGGLARAELFAPALARYYIDRGGWDGIHEALMTLSATSSPNPGLGSGRQRWQENASRALGFTQYRIIVSNSEGEIIADTGETLELGRQLSESELDAGVALNINQSRVGTVLVLADASDFNAQLAEQFRSSVDRSVVIAGIVVGALALAVAFVLSRQILAPLGKLTVAARQIAAGDLSQRVRVSSQDEVGDLAGTFNTMTASLQSQQELRQRLMADVAHELRTPLAVIRGNLEALLDGVHPLTEENVSAILDEVLLLGRLTDDLRELALAEAGQLQLHREALDLGDLVYRIFTGLEPLTEEREIRLSSDIPEGLPAAYADQQRLSQVFHNLLSNAIRHTPAGGEIRVSAERAENPAFLRVTVSDTGSGIAPADLPSLFERFNKGNISRRREQGGTGLGLSIVKQFIEAHDGQIGVESKLGKGTTITFTLPIALEE